jgi:hypothetical protein
MFGVVAVFIPVSVVVALRGLRFHLGRVTDVRCHGSAPACAHHLAQQDEARRREADELTVMVEHRTNAK